MREKHYKQIDFQMIKITTMLITLFILICSLSNILLACQYNVRETGFADFEMSQYKFYGYINSETPDDIVINFEQACSSVFINCNI